MSKIITIPPGTPRADQERVFSELWRQLSNVAKPGEIRNAGGYRIRVSDRLARPDAAPTPAPAEAPAPAPAPSDEGSTDTGKTEPVTPTTPAPAKKAAPAKRAPAKKKAAPAKKSATKKSGAAKRAKTTTTKE